MICVKCNKEFVSKREDAKYCSSKCRKLAFLKKDLSVPELSVPLSVPEYGVLKCQVEGCVYKRSPGHHNDGGLDTCIRHWNRKM